MELPDFLAFSNDSNRRGGGVTSPLPPYWTGLRGRLGAVARAYIYCLWFFFLLAAFIGAEQRGIVY